MSVRGFTLLEAMISMAIAGIVVSAALTSYRVGIAQSADQRREWNAFTIAQQRIELLSSFSPAAPDLSDNAPDTISPTQIGTGVDTDCSNGVDGSLSVDMKVDALGFPNANGRYMLCWKVTPGSPAGNLLNLRVVTGYLDDFGNRQFLLLQNVVGGD